MSVEEQRIYTKTMTTEIDIRERIKEGREEGREEGGQGKALEIANKMIAKGFSIEDISELTGLSKEDIIKL